MKGTIHSVGCVALILIMTPSHGVFQASCCLKLIFMPPYLPLFLSFAFPDLDRPVGDELVISQ